jgi:glycosyltransferase involved in cell wall biosynthesis
MSVCVVIPSIPSRSEQLERALRSVFAQDRPVDQLSIAFDTERSGSSATRNRAAVGATTEWIAFLDDDDEFDPHHISTCLNHAEKTGADLVFPWHRVLRYGEPIDDVIPFRGIEDDRITSELENQNFIPVSVLVKTSAFRELGGFPEPNSEEWPHSFATDWGCWLRMARSGAKFSHINEVTWTWHHWGYGKPGEPGNTSGQATRW